MPAQRPSLPALVELLQVARQGDASALEQLLRLYLPITRQIVELRLGRRLRDIVAIEDVVQEALIEVFRELDHFEMRSEGEFCNWLARLVERRVRERLGRVGSGRRPPRRSQLAPRSSALDARLDAWLDPVRHEGVQAATSRLEEELERALMYMLEEPHREVLILRKLCGMSAEETAHSMGFERTRAVHELYSEALGRLGEAWGPDP